MSATVILGDAAGEHVRVAVTSYAHPGGLHVFDHDWLFAEVVARTAARGLRCHAFMRTADFAAFEGELHALLGGTVSDAELWPDDPWITVEVSAEDGAAGNAFRLDVRARDGGSERAVRVDRRIDRAELERLAEQVAEVARRYPVQGPVTP